MSAVDSIEAIRRRAEAAHQWLLRDQREQTGSEWLPLSVREHFTDDVPRLLAEIERLRERESKPLMMCTAGEVVMVSDLGAFLRSGPVTPFAADSYPLVLVPENAGLDPILETPRKASA